MIDRSAIGRHTGTHEIAIERGRLRFFARVTGQTSPIYTDVEAARLAGYPDLPVPPTLLLGLEVETGCIFRTLDSLNVDLGNVLHGEQEFVYHKMVFAGDVLLFKTHIADIYSRKEGALEFVVRETNVTRGNELIATMRNVMVSVSDGIEGKTT